MDQTIDQELQVLAEAPKSRFAPFGTVQKVKYSHEAMIDMIIARPQIRQKELAVLFGFSPGWISNVMASDAFQAALAARRQEMVDPILLATVEERFKGLVHQSLCRLQEKLDAPQVSDNTVLRALELGAKALGVGGNAAPRMIPVDLSDLKGRLLALHGGVAKEIEGTSRRVEE